MKREEIKLRGIPISGGVGIGSPVYFPSEKEELYEEILEKRGIEEEILRYRRALDLSRRDLEMLQRNSTEANPSEVVAILDTHLEMIQDPIMTSGIEERIREKRGSAESIFRHFIAEYKERFKTVEDVYFQERVRDIVDVSGRILGHLNPFEKISIERVAPHSILLTEELLPTDTVEATENIEGFITLIGGVTSHAAIIARAKRIPFVANIDIKALRKEKIDMMIVDGSQGILILNPTLKTLEKYQEKKRDILEEYKRLKKDAHLLCETIDGYEVEIFANLENPKEIDLLQKCGAVGVGLFRSEYLYLSQKRIPSEEEQFQVYKKMGKALSDQPLVIRVFDIGGDKKVKDGHVPFVPELNPALGCRAIRFLLRYPEILKEQLRAILRASVFGNVEILVPMVSDVVEIIQFKRILKGVKEDLKREGVQIKKRVPLGCMIEVPSIAFGLEALFEHVDFVSIGTNDLIQYMLAVDRNNVNTAKIYTAPHPSVLRLIQMVVSSAACHNKPVIVCGELAADVSMIPILIGLGISEFSVAARHIPHVKNTIRKWRILEAIRLAEGAIQISSSSSLKEYLKVHALRE